MDPEERLIDSLLREHNRVAGEVDEDFLQKLEQQLDKQLQPAKPKRKKQSRLVHLWAPATIAAGIAILISISVYQSKQQQEHQFALDTQQMASPDLKQEPSLSPENLSSPPLHAPDAVESASEPTQPTPKKAKVEMRQAKLSDHQFQSNLFSNEDYSAAGINANSLEAFEKELQQAEALLSEVSHQALPAEALALSAHEKKALRQAFAILKQRTQTALLTQRISNSALQSAPESTSAPRLQSLNEQQSSTQKFRGKERAISSTQALQLFQSLFASKAPSPKKLSSSNAGRLDKGEAALKALDAWDKALR